MLFKCLFKNYLRILFFLSKVSRNLFLNDKTGEVIVVRWRSGMVRARNAQGHEFEFRAAWNFFFVIFIIIIIITTTGGMAEECRRYHCRLAELISTKKGETYAATISWIRTKVSFVILRGALLCLRGSRTSRRRQFANIRNNDLEIENGLAGLA